MRFLLIPDKFKGSLSAQEVIHAISRGLEAAVSSVEIHSILASDGGDGFLEAVKNYLQVEEIWVDTVDPLGRPVKAPYLFDKTNKKAYLELAGASGLVLLDPEERQVMETSTFGTGLQLRHALSKGAKTIYLGLGGSATNDGGLGMASALGYNFRDKNGSILEPKGKNLNAIEKIDSPQDIKATFVAINDVNNPLFGPYGAAYVYAEQKGATDREIEVLDQGLRALHNLVKQDLGSDVAEVPGSGAAGGSAFGLKAFFGADFLSGIDFVLDLAGAKELLQKEQIDFIITGEGKIDDQTLHGKLISGVVEMATTYQIPALAVCGILDTEPQLLRNQGLRDIIEVRDPAKPLAYNMENAAMLIEKAVSNYFRALANL